MLLQIFAGSLLPYVEGLDSWLFEGTLDDPFEEVGVLGVVFMFHGFSTIFLYLFMPTSKYILYKASKLKV